MTDGELIEAARFGDAEAWRELYARWMPWVWRYAYSLVRDSHLAEDVTSEAMTAWVRCFEKTGSDAPQAAAWLRSVVRHKAADHYRRGARFRRATEGVAQITDPMNASDEPGFLAERAEERAQVVLALRRLKEPHRLALEWKYAQGLSVREIAERLGVTEKAAEANLYRARREFRRQYEVLQPPADEEPAPPRRDNSTAKEAAVVPPSKTKP